MRQSFKKPLFVVILLFVVVVAGVLGYRHYIIVKLQEQVLLQLSDPDTAKFRNITLYSNWTVDGSAICGEVNAKNRMGGYVGYRRFDVIGRLNVSIQDEWEAKFFADRPELTACPFKSVRPWWHLR